MRQTVRFLVCLILLFVCFAPGAMAEDIAVVEEISFNQMPPFEEDGGFPSIGEIEEVGYETARNWISGEYPVDVLKLGDIIDGLNPGEFRFSDLLDLNEFEIADVPLLSEIDLNTLLKSVPFSGDWPVEELTGVAEALEQRAGVIPQAQETLGQIITRDAAVGDLQTGAVFGELPLATIPNLDVSKISDFEGYKEQAISSIPGLGDIALGNFPNVLARLSPTAKQDIAFGKTEYSGSKPTPTPVSGSVKEGFAVPCIGGCPHIELTGPGWEGAQWMTKDHKVPDGSGFLGSLPGFGEAGAYRIPFGKAFALQIRSTDEKTGSAEWGIAFRVCKRGFIDLGCTAYFLDVPVGVTTYEKDTVLTGINDGLGGSSSPIEAPPGWKELRPEIPPELMGAIGAAGGGGRGSRGLCGKGPGGVDYAALAVAFSQIEGNYDSVGEPTSGGLGARGQELFGVGLGRYQYMSYREDVRAVISPQPGGAELLAKADRGAPITAAEVARSFPPEVQDRLFRQDQEKLVEKAISEGAEGADIIKRIGQMHYGGTAGEIDSTSTDVHERLSIKTYGEELLENYNTALEGGESECGQSTGNFIYPVDGPSQKTSPFGERVHPISGKRRFHNGLDIGAAEGITVIASDGGTIIAATYNSSSGNHIIMDHQNGYTTSYSHLSAMTVKSGDSVNQGDKIGAIGTTGNSTGPHLHFVLKKNGGYEDPDDYI